MKWKEVRDLLLNLTDEQLDKPVIGLIDAEPWEASAFKVTAANDEAYPNHPYLMFD